MRWLYRIGTAAYHLGIRVAAHLGKKKARQWINGRKSQKYKQSIAHLHAVGRPILWFHAASLGEFEQGRPVLEELRRLHPDAAVVLTFFSPSGYERCSDTELAEVVAYLPRDSPGRAREWVADLRPTAAIFVKYDFWYYHLRALSRAEVPIFLVAGSFRPDQPFFQWYGSLWRQMLDFYTLLLVQTESDRSQLLTLNYPQEKIRVAGDPRMDRTLALAATDFQDARLANFTGEYPTLFAGSVWPEDVEAIATAWPTLPEDWRLVLAPHQLEEKELEAWQESFSAERYTQPPANSRVLLLDTIGILSRAYRYGAVAYVGGAFRTGLHNTLEPMSYHLPVIFGPHYQKFPEARTGVETGGAFTIQDGKELVEILTKLRSPDNYSRSQAAVRAYTKAQAGAGKRTAYLISQLLFLLLLVFPLRAQTTLTSSSHRQALDNLFEKCNLMVAISEVDWRPGLCIGATRLGRGQTISLRLKLRAGYDYAFVATGDHHVTDLDLYLRGPDQETIRLDTESDNTPIVDFTIDSTGGYTLQLHLVAAAQDEAYVAVGFLRDQGLLVREDDYRSLRREMLERDLFGGGTAGNWINLGYLLDRGEGHTLSGLPLPVGQLTVTTSTGPNFRNVDLYLADRERKIVAADYAPDATPKISYRTEQEERYDLRLEVERARQVGLILLTLN